MGGEVCRKSTYGEGSLKDKNVETVELIDLKSKI